MPAIWVQQLGKLLDNGTIEIKSQILGLIESRGIKVLNEQLKMIVQNPGTSPDFRLKALSSKLLSEPNLTDVDFQMVLSYLDSKNESPIRQMAARLLAKAKLNDNQLINNTV
jgi:hypothetical protein